MRCVLDEKLFQIGLVGMFVYLLCVVMTILKRNRRAFWHAYFVMLVMSTAIKASLVWFKYSMSCMIVLICSSVGVVVSGEKRSMVLVNKCVRFLNDVSKYT